MFNCLLAWKGREFCVWSRVWGKRPGKARPRPKCDNAGWTFAYTTKLEGLGEDCSAYKRVIGNFMRTLLIILLFAGFYQSSWGCCSDDNRTLTEMLFQGKAGTIFTCKVLTFSTPTYPDNIIVSSSDGSIDGTAIVEIITVYFGNVDTNIVTLRAGSYMTVGMTYLIYTGGSGRIFGFGGNCDRWSKQVKDNSVTGIDENELDFGVNIHPNPTNNQITIDFNLLDVTEVSLEILDATGRVVASHNLGNLPNGFQSITLNVSNLSNGLYLCNIKAGETKISKRIIKN